MKSLKTFIVLTFLSVSVLLAGSTPSQSNRDHHKNSSVCLLHHKNCNHVIVPPPIDPPVDNGNGGSTTNNVPPVVDTTIVSAESAPTLTIADVSTVYDTMNINSLLKVKSLAVGVNITHSYIGDLVLILRHDGVRSVLMNQRGGYLRDLDLTFDMSSTQNISTLPMILPVVGVFSPETSLDVFNGLPAGGDWTLEVIDSFVGDVGTLNSWNIVLETY